jgi:hypothetical protein
MSRAQLDREHAARTGHPAVLRPPHPPGSLRRAGLGWRLRMSGDVALAWYQGVTSGFSA